MSNSIETGHAKNVANLNVLINHCISFGDKYRPSRLALTISALQDLYKNSMLALKEVKNAVSDFNNATNIRMAEFEDLKPLVTRIINGLDSTEASVETVKDAKAIVRKLRGQRAPVSKKKEEPLPTITTNAEETDLPEPDPKTISASQRSYDLQVEHLDKLHSLLSKEVNYTPNEEEISVTGIGAVLTQLLQSNDRVSRTVAALSRGRSLRNNLMYAELTGLVALAADVKKYVRSIYTPDTIQYQDVMGIQFRYVE